MTKNSNETFINTSMTYCVQCGQSHLVTILANNRGIYMRKHCPAIKQKDIKIADSYEWYMERMHHPQAVRTPSPAKKFEHGCPLDCGLCEHHCSEIHLPVFSITNDCNLNCPICFTYNRPDKKYYKSCEDTEKVIKGVLQHRENLEVINLTGGEPALHPALFKIIELCKRKEIKRITINTNGIKIAEDHDFAVRIKQADVQMVLSLNTFDPEKSKIIHGRDIVEVKKKALEVFESLDIPVTILCVAIKDLNEEDVAEIVSTYIKKEFVKSFTIQNMTFTGAQGGRFEPRKHITLDEVEQALAVPGTFSRKDFFPLGSAHPLCYSIAYYLVSGNKILALTRLIDKHKLSELCSDSYLLPAEHDFSRDFLDGINRLWAEGEDENYIRSLRDFFKRLYPDDRTLKPEQREKIAESLIKSVYIHAHMDEDNFDLDRLSRCADIVPDETGNMIPACSYNLIYRKRDERFWVQSV